jgi:hypothetical protein
MKELASSGDARKEFYSAAVTWSDDRLLSSLRLAKAVEK